MRYDPLQYDRQADTPTFFAASKPIVGFCGSCSFECLIACFCRSRPYHYRISLLHHLSSSTREPLDRPLKAVVRQCHSRCFVRNWNCVSSFAPLSYAPEYALVIIFSVRQPSPTNTHIVIDYPNHVCSFPYSEQQSDSNPIFLPVSSPLFWLYFSARLIVSSYPLSLDTPVPYIRSHTIRGPATARSLTGWLGQASTTSYGTVFAHNCSRQNHIVVRC